MVGFILAESSFKAIDTTGDAGGDLNSNFFFGADPRIMRANVFI
jgi:hypothetical protein